MLVHLAAEPRSAPELAEILDVAKPTGRRILALLTYGGYVGRVPDDTYRKRYRLTPRGQLVGLYMATAGSFAAES
jgi:DNA-binding IclR family transcriptional regulator